MFFLFALVVVVVVAVGYIGWKMSEELLEPILVGALAEIKGNAHTNNTPIEKKGTHEIKCGNKKEIKPLLTPDKENSQVRQRKVNNSKKESDDVKKVEVSEEKKKLQRKDKNEIKKKENQEVMEKKKLRERQQKSAPVCPVKEFCDEQNCENVCEFLCSECNTYLCKDCSKNMKPGIHCIQKETMQKIIAPAICEVNKHTTDHPMDCYLRNCKHVFHKACLEENYYMNENFKKCLTCIDERIPTEEFKLTDILTDFFDPVKDAVWKIYPVRMYEPKKKQKVAEE